MPFFDMGFYFELAELYIWQWKKACRSGKNLFRENCSRNRQSVSFSGSEQGKRNSLKPSLWAGKIAELKEITPEQVMQVTFANAEQVYGFQKKKQ